MTQPGGEDDSSADTWIADDAPSMERSTPAALPERYRDRGRLGIGGMGEVRRVEDAQLKRVLAMKILRGDGERREARFLAEAQTTAQLQHPGIVPVHDCGVTPDGRPYFTMPEVRGRTLADVIEASHDPQDAWGWPLRRVLEVFRRVCEAVAYAHQRGVVHRDLKPENVMLGTHGEVRVLDWGIAKAVGAPTTREAPIATDRDTAPSLQTSAGAVSGTPAYMSPEQGTGDAVDARSDVYALGTVLYEIVAGQLPFNGEPFAILTAKLTEEPPPLRRRVYRADEVCEGRGDLTLPMPDGLRTICERAMSREPDGRFADASALGDEIGAWLDGVRRRDDALAHVRRAEAAEARAVTHRERARVLRDEAHAMSEGIEAWRPVEDKHPLWRLEDRAAEEERDGEAAQLEARRHLALAVETEPGLPEAHAALAALARDEHRASEERRDAGAAARAEAELVRHTEALPADHPVSVELGRYLEGTGALSLSTEPAGARVTLFRFEERGRRLTAVPHAPLGQTPIHEARLPMGSYLVVLEHGDRRPVRYPVHIAREGRWSAAAPVRITESLDDRECFVPAGPFVIGGDPAVPEPTPRARAYADDFVIQRFPVTNAEYIEFLDALVRDGRPDEAQRWQPRERGSQGQPGEPIFAQRADGTFEIVADADGDVWEPAWPVLMIDWFCARAYAEWVAERTGLPWRLPTALEWEKAARGVDGRFFPWGDHYDGTWACTMLSHRGYPQPSVVDSFPVDQSVYGVRGLAGGVRDWTSTRSDGSEEPIAPDTRVEARGGFWCGSARAARSAHRYGIFARTRDTFHGMRLARSSRGTPL